MAAGRIKQGDAYMYHIDERNWMTRKEVQYKYDFSDEELDYYESSTDIKQSRHPKTGEILWDADDALDAWMFANRFIYRENSVKTIGQPLSGWLKDQLRNKGIKPIVITFTYREPVEAWPLEEIRQVLKVI
jgi:hypothetical protein